MEKLRQHDTTLTDGPLVLRPLTEDDWGILMPWYNDPDVLWFSEGRNITSWSLDDLQEMFRSVSQTAHTFIAEVDGKPIGDCWLQQMNLQDIIDRHPGKKLYRIDPQLGEKRLWGRGWGTRIIGLLTRFGFEQCGADAVFGVGVGSRNPRSRRAFEKNGYVIDQEIVSPPGAKDEIEYNLMLTKERFVENQRLLHLDAGLRAEADAMLAESGLGEIIRSEGFHPVGSYVMRTMTWRDLDFEREHEAPDWSAHWELGRRLAACKWVWKFSCADAYRDPQNQDVGHYWGLRASNPAGGSIWKLDLWTARAGEFARSSPHRSDWARKLNDENRSRILAIKEAVCMLPEYRKTLLSVHIYEAVLDDGVRSIEEFRAWLEKR